MDHSIAHDGRLVVREHCSRIATGLSPCAWEATSPVNWTERTGEIWQRQTWLSTTVDKVTGTDRIHEAIGLSKDHSLPWVTHPPSPDSSPTHCGYAEMGKGKRAKKSPKGKAIRPLFLPPSRRLFGPTNKTHCTTCCAWCLHVSRFGRHKRDIVSLSLYLPEETHQPSN